MESSTKEQASHRSSIALAVPQQILIHAPLWERPCASMGRQDYFKFQIHVSVRKRPGQGDHELRGKVHFDPYSRAETTRYQPEE